MANKKVENHVNIPHNCCTIVSKIVGIMYIERMFQIPVTGDAMKIPCHTYSIEE